ncbi:transporter [Undibacterium sp. YM2]|uniref:TolC family protein n=1 Tax=Undibacterium sp. YM2 TaxID=2058625 RepID=UPI001331C685|nr:TolC family protein [Undibacterium sp. YM2]BBB68783.1 transporter [Undibacterium sp. YM2]
MSQAQQLALARSRQLSAQDFAISAARDMAVAASQLPDPVLKAGIDNLPVSGPDRGSLTNDFMTMRRVGLMQEITRSDKRQLRAERYERVINKSQAEKMQTTFGIVRDTSIAWLERYYSEKMLALVREQLNQARLEIQAAELAYRSGRGSQADLLTARSALALMEDRNSELTRRARNASIMLTRWTGETSTDSLGALPAMDQVGLDISALESTLEHHPQINIMNRQVELADTEAKLAEANKKPDWSIEVAYQQRGPAYSNMVSVGLSLPLQWDQKNRQQRELSSRLAMADQARAERDEALRSHIAEVSSLLNEWQSKRSRVDRYGNELLPLAAQKVQAILAAYRGGKSSLGDLLAAQRNQTDMHLQALQLQAETASVWAQLRYLTPLNQTRITPDMNRD